MSKRFTDTQLWEEDWFIELEKDYQMFWIYLKDACDHAGVWKPNLGKFKKLFDCRVDLKKALEFFNKDKDRVAILKNKRWFLTGFIPFQYGEALNLASRMHLSVYELLQKNEVSLTIIRPQIEVKHRVKDKDKDKEKEKNNKAVKNKIFKKPTVEEIRVYCQERQSGIDPQHFYDKNEAIGWVVGKNRTPMKDWQAVIRTWEKNNRNGDGVLNVTQATAQSMRAWKEKYAPEGV